MVYSKSMIILLLLGVLYSAIGEGYYTIANQTENSFVNTLTQESTYLSDIVQFTPLETLYPPDDIEVGAEYQQPARLRNSMLHSAFDCPGKLCDAGYNLVASMPRIYGPSEIPQSIKDQDWGHSDTKDYIIGLASFSFIFPFIFFLISACLGLWFCVCRGCCNTCGQRIATKQYTKTQVCTLRIGLLIWLVLLALVGFLTIATNHGISRGLDDTVQGSDGVFTFVDTTLTTLSSTADPFSSRIVQLNHVVNALQRLPAQPQRDAMVQCYTAHQQAISDHVELNKLFVAKRNEIATIDSVSELTPVLDPIRQSLSQFKDMENDNPRSEWVASATHVRDVMDNLQYTTSPPIGQLYQTASVFHHHLVRFDVVVNHAMSPNQDQAGLFAHPQQALEAIRDVIFANPISQYFRQRTVSTSECQSLQPGLSSIQQALSRFVQLENAVGGVTALFQKRIETATTLLPQWRYIQHHLTSMVSMIDTLLTQHTTFVGTITISPLLTLDIERLTAIEGAVAMMDQLVLSIRDAISHYGGDATAQQQFDVTGVSAAITAATSATPVDAAGEWSLLAQSTAAYPFLDNCVSDISDALHTGNEWIVSVSDRISFLPKHNDMLQALKLDTDGHAATVKANIAAAANSVSLGISPASIQSSSMALTNIADELRSNGNPYAGQRLSALRTSLHTTLEAFNSIKISEFNAISTDRQHIEDLGGLVQHVDKINEGLTTLAALGSYTTVSDEIRRVLRARLLVHIGAALSELGSCSAPVTFSPVVDIDNIRTSLATIHDIGSTSHQPSVNAHIQSLTGVAAAYQAISQSKTQRDATILALSPYPSPDSLSPPDFADIDLENRTTPQVSTNLQQFTSQLASLEQHGSVIVTDLVQYSQFITDNMNQIMVEPGPAAVFNAPVYAMHLLVSGRVLPSDPAHQIPQFPYSPFVANPNYNVDQQMAIELGTYIQVLAQARDYQADAISVRDDVTSRIDTLDESVTEVRTFLEDYFDLRSTVKRDGYLIDEQRLIIMDVLVSLVLIFSFFMVALAMFRFHKVQMFCVMLLSPLCTLFFLLACIHLTPSLLLTDVCEEPHDIIQSFIGGAEVSSGFINGFVTFLGETPEPVNTSALYAYFTLCETEPPQFLRLLRDANPQSNGILTDELADLRESLNAMMAQHSLTMAPHLSQTFDSLLSVSQDLVDKAHELFNSVECNKTEGVVQGVVDDALCAGFAQSMTLCGCLCFLLSLCMCPGMFLGIRAFKRLNRRNDVEYRRVIRKGADGTTFVHESAGTDDTGEIVHYKHQELGFEEDDMDYTHLKGFNQQGQGGVGKGLPPGSQGDMELARY